MDTTVVEVAPPANDKLSVTLTTLKRRAATRRWRAAHPEQVAAQVASYYRVNRETILKSSRDYYVAHGDELRNKRRARYRARRNRLFQQRKKRYWRHNAVIRMCSREYYAARRRGQLRLVA